MSDLTPALTPIPERVVTIVIPTSPIPSHPSTGVLDATLASLDEVGLGGCEVILTADGVRPEQANRAGAYYDYLRAVTDRASRTGTRIVPIVHRTHQHQARMMRDALDHVRTPLVLYVEHDTPLVDPIDWPTVIGPLMLDLVDVIRFYPEERLEPQHAYLMEEPITLGGTRFVPTVQWSQRPHLAQRAYYRRILDDHFDPEERWMIEDRMHSVAQSEQGHRILIYADDAPGRGIQRSAHLDGRGADPKWTDR